MSANERRGFFDECHWGEIDPGYVHLYQSGNLVGEGWVTFYQIDVLFYSNYKTPGKAGTSQDLKLVVMNPPSTVPAIASSISALKAAKQPFTHVRYGGTVIQFWE